MEPMRRAEIFINVHKGLRRGLWGLAQRIGELDWDRPEQVQAAGRELEDITRFLREHAANEDQIQFPFLEGRAPGTTQQEQDEHRELETRLDLLEKHWYQLLREEHRDEAGYRFYLEYNQFVARYLDHMDREERHLTEAFYRYCSDPEIDAAFKQIVARTSPQAMDMVLSYTLPAMSPSERLGFMAKAKAEGATEVLAVAQGVAKRALTPESWEELSRRLG